MGYFGVLEGFLGCPVGNNGILWGILGSWKVNGVPHGAFWDPVGHFGVLEGFFGVSYGAFWCPMGSFGVL